MQTCGLTRPRHAAGSPRGLRPLPLPGGYPQRSHGAPPRGVDVKQPPRPLPGGGWGALWAALGSRTPGWAPSPWDPGDRVPRPPPRGGAWKASDQLREAPGDREASATPSARGVLHQPLAAGPCPRSAAGVPGNRFPGPGGPPGRPRTAPSPRRGLRNPPRWVQGPGARG